MHRRAFVTVICGLVLAPFGKWGKASDPLSRYAGKIAAGRQALIDGDRRLHGSRVKIPCFAGCGRDCPRWEEHIVNSGFEGFCSMGCLERWKRSPAYGKYLRECLARCRAAPFVEELGAEEELLEEEFYWIRRIQKHNRT